MAMFAAVVREGGFGKAAAALGVSKSNVSKQIGRLEEQLGVRLLARTTRVVQPTEAGELFYERCIEMLRVSDEAQGVLSSLQEQAVGRLRISVPLSFGRAFLEKPLLRYLDGFPRVQADIEMSDRSSDVIREGLDIAIRVGPVHDDNLIVQRLCETRRIVVGSPAYLRANQAPLTPEELSSHQCLLYEYQQVPERWVFRRGGRRVEVAVSGRLRTNNGDFLAAAACAGHGLAYLPDFIVHDYVSSGQLVAVLESQCHETSVVNVVLPARKHVPVKVRELMRVLREDMVR
jgi:DNA-binding transcriptional LysR family regulator